MIKLASLILAALLAVGCVTPIDDRGLPFDAEPPPAAPAAPMPEPVTYPTAPVVAEAPKPAPPLPPIRVWISPAVDKADEVRAGVEAWAQSTAGVRDWTIVEASADDVADHDVADVAIYEIGPYGGTCGGSEGGETSGALGCVQGVGGLWDNRSGSAMGLYLINTTFSADGHAQDGYQQNAKLVTMHELGHLLGLGHKDGGIMAAGATKAALAADWECPDADTIDRLEAKLKIDGLTACAEPEL